MDDLAAWLLEQIDEDARIATNDGRVQAAEWTALATGPESDWSAPWEVLRVGGVAFRAIDHEARHAANWDPKRVLAECDSKRRIVEGLREDLQAASGAVGADEFGSRLTTELKAVAVLRWLTLPYSDRPGYREEEWKP